MARSKMNREREYTSSMEDYLETIKIIQEENKSDGVKIKDISEKMNVKMSSVNNALQTLSKLGLINYKPYKQVTLTSKGNKLAKKLYLKHKLLKDIFYNFFLLEEDIAEKIACDIEHYIPEYIVKKLLIIRKQIIKNPSISYNEIIKIIKNNK